MRTTKGLTPFLYAASKGKMVSFEVLLKDSRVDINLRDGEDQTALELITALGKEIKVNEAKELLAKRKETPLVQKDTTKLAILIANSEYKENKRSKDSVSWDDLPGAKKDVTDMEARMKANGYKVEVIENSPDILLDIQEVMNTTPVSSVTHLQLLYVGE